VKKLTEENVELKKMLHAEMEEKAKTLRAKRRLELMQEYGSFEGTATKRALPDSSSSLLEPEPKRARRILHRQSENPGERALVEFGLRLGHERKSI
jgi:hypothetical protein